MSTPCRRECSPSECIAMGSAPYDQSLSSSMLSDVRAWDGECSLPKGLGDGERSPCAVRVHGERSLSKGPGSCARYPCGGWGYGEHSLCAVPLADSALHRSGFGWGALPIIVSGRLGALSISRKGY
jgi:hypothetical protein